MKKRLLILGLTLVLFGGSFYVIQNYNKKSVDQKTTENKNLSKDTNNISQSPINQSAVKIKAQDFKLINLDGKEVILSSLKGKRVFLNFWATWCPPCKAEMPELEKLYQEAKDSDLVILAINLGDASDTVKEFMHANNYTFSPLLDMTNDVGSKYDVSGIPASYFINKEGFVVSKFTGAMSLEEMKRHISELK